MKNQFKLLAMAAFVPVFAMAQTSLDEEVNAELDKMYQAQPASMPQAQRTTGPAVQVNVQTQPTVTATQNQGAVQDTAQVSGQTQTQLAAQKQPTTVIQAGPLVESKADMIRKDRQDAELQTEQKIVEKLEQSRLEDEKKRAEVLFGDKFNTLMNQGYLPPQMGQPAQQPVQAVQPQVVAPVAPVPVVPVVVPEQVVAPAPVIVERSEKEEKLDRDTIRSEVSAALSEFKKEEDVKPKTSTTYLSIMTGAGEYPDAINVKGQYSLGIALGRKVSDRVVAEGSFMFSNYEVEQPATYGNGGQIYNYQTGQYDYYPRITDMNQYSTSGLVKYQLLGGALRPEVGALMSYTYRTFSDKQFALTDATVSSQAIDYGLMAGASLEVSEGFSLGLDFRYMWNMTNKIDGTTLQKSAIYQGSPAYTPIEDLSYYNFSVVGRATF